MKDLDRNLILNICQEVMLDVVKESSLVREQLTFKQHIGLCEYVTNMSYQESVEMLYEFGVRDFESKFGAAVKYGAAAIIGGVVGKKLKVGKMLGLTVGLLFMYIFRKSTDPCWQACFRKEPDKKSICKYFCYIKGCESVISDINKQINRCSDTKNPVKCERGLNKALVKWKKKRENYRKLLNQEKDKYADSEAKKRLRNIKKKREVEDKLKAKAAGKPGLAK